MPGMVNIYRVKPNCSPFLFIDTFEIFFPWDRCWGGVEIDPNETYRVNMNITGNKLCSSFLNPGTSNLGALVNFPLSPYVHP